MADVSVALFWLGAALTAAAVLCQLAALFGSRVVRRTAVTNAGTLTVSERQPPSALWGRLGSAFSLAAAVSLVLMLVARTIATGHPPYSNMFEYLTAFGAGVVIAAIVFERRSGGQRVGVFAMPLALALFLVADVAFSSEVRPLVPALQNNRLLAVHVAAMLVSYSVFGVAFIAAALYLIQGERNRFAWLPSASVLDEITYKAVIVAFPVLGLGIALGAYWGNIAWGRWWGWDPKETAALVTFLLMAAYMHTRAIHGWSGRRSAVLLVLTFFATLFTFFGNLFLGGLHAYSGL